MKVTTTPPHTIPNLLDDFFFFLHMRAHISFYSDQSDGGSVGSKGGQVFSVFYPGFFNFRLVKVLTIHYCISYKT